MSQIVKSPNEKLIHTERITSTVASVQFAVPNTNAYKKLIMEWDLLHANAATYVDMFMQWVLNGTLYTGSYIASAQAFNASTNSGQNITTSIQLSSTISHTDNQQSGRCWMNNMVGIKRKCFGQFTGDAGNGWVGGVFSGMQNGADADQKIEEIKIFGSQNLSNGSEIRLYGVKK